MKSQSIALILAIAFLSFGHASATELFEKPQGVQTRWSTFENMNGEKGAGGPSNRGAKGHAMEPLLAGETKTLLDIEGSGTIRRIWMTLQPLRFEVSQNLRAEQLRATRIDMYWDGASTPAVSAPIGDFFGAILGRPVVHESALFANPEGRSFNCYIPMPFRDGARVTVTNEGEDDIAMLFYEIDLTTGDAHGDNALYFHATWRRENPTTLGNDFEILPKVSGAGRFLGAHLGIILDPANKGWWGEGEVKAYIDGDTDLPTLVGTGTEDYIGTGWGQATYTHRYQGCLVADVEARHYTFYRYHVPDPVFFDEDCRVTIHQMGGADKRTVQRLIEDGVEVQPVTVLHRPDGVNVETFKILDQDPVPKLTDTSVPDGWVNHFRRDDWSATAFFYLDKPENGLPPLADVEARTADLRSDRL